MAWHKIRVLSRDWGRALAGRSSGRTFIFLAGEMMIFMDLYLRAAMFLCIVTYLGGERCEKVASELLKNCNNEQEHMIKVFTKTEICIVISHGIW